MTNNCSRVGYHLMKPNFSPNRNQLGRVTSSDSLPLLWSSPFESHTVPRSSRTSDPFALYFLWSCLPLLCPNPSLRHQSFRFCGSPPLSSTRQISGGTGLSSATDRGLLCGPSVTLVDLYLTVDLNVPPPPLPPEDAETDSRP